VLPGDAGRDDTETGHGAIFVLGFRLLLSHLARWGERMGCSLYTTHCDGWVISLRRLGLVYTITPSSRLKTLDSGLVSLLHVYLSDCASTVALA
jgi:hypothetical protein